MQKRIRSFRHFLRKKLHDDDFTRLHKAETIGRLVGSKEFIASLEVKLGVDLDPKKRGPKAGSVKSLIHHKRNRMSVLLLLYFSLQGGIYM